MDRLLELIACGCFGAVALWIIRTDMREHRIPNAAVLAGAVLVGAPLAAAAWASGDPAGVIRGVAGAGALGGFYLVLWSAGGGMGGGDVKLAALVGLFLGWHGWPAFGIGAAAAFVLGGVSSLALVAVRRATRRTRIAFAPFMLLGACLGPLLGAAPA